MIWIIWYYKYTNNILIYKEIQGFFTKKVQINLFNNHRSIIKKF